MGRYYYGIWVEGRLTENKKRKAKEKSQFLRATRSGALTTAEEGPHLVKPLHTVQTDVSGSDTQNTH